ncbi:MAG: hypothetical protein ABSD74_14790 [Rhizomicrobium sp.]|jgi:hypothetical protein
MRNILIGAATVSFLLAGTFGASAGQSWCRLSVRSCPHIVQTQLTSACKVARACPGAN